MATNKHLGSTISIMVGTVPLKLLGVKDASWEARKLVEIVDNDGIVYAPGLPVGKFTVNQNTETSHALLEAAIKNGTPILVKLTENGALIPTFDFDAIVTASGNTGGSESVATRVLTFGEAA